MISNWNYGYFSTFRPKIAKKSFSTLPYPLAGCQFSYFVILMYLPHKYPSNKPLTVFQSSFSLKLQPIFSKILTFDFLLQFNRLSTHYKVPLPHPFHADHFSEKIRSKALTVWILEFFPPIKGPPREATPSFSSYPVWQKMTEIDRKWRKMTENDGILTENDRGASGGGPIAAS